MIRQIITLISIHILSFVELIRVHVDQSVYKYKSLALNFRSLKISSLFDHLFGRLIK